MSLLASSRISDPALRTDLGDAFDAHMASHARDPALALGSVETDWLNVMRDRAAVASDAHLLTLTNDMLALLQKPTTSTTFKDDFMALYEQAERHAYPLAFKFRDEQHAIVGLTRDYTLQCFDPGMLRRMEDDAIADKTMQSFVREMLYGLNARSRRPRHEVLRGVFEVYSEALAYKLLTEAGGGRLTIDKIPEGPNPSPDFECTLQLAEPGPEPRDLRFYIEVKALDIVDAPQRIPEMLDEGLDTEIEIERQQRAGHQVAIAVGEIRRFGRL